MKTDEFIKLPEDFARQIDQIAKTLMSSHPQYLPFTHEHILEALENTDDNDVAFLGTYLRRHLLLSAGEKLERIVTNYWYSKALTAAKDELESNPHLAEDEHGRPAL